MTDYIPVLEELFSNMTELLNSEKPWTVDMNDAWIGEFPPKLRFTLAGLWTLSDLA